MTLERTMREALLRSSKITLPIIFCFFTGKKPDFVAKMPRDPDPKIGMRFDANFGAVFEDALANNPAIHDGAILIGRDKPISPYYVAGWSYRLLPPDIHNAIPNKGSAFNSCLAMSEVDGVDRLHLMSRNGHSIFQGGRVILE